MIACQVGLKVSFVETFGRLDKLDLGSKVIVLHVTDTVRFSLKALQLATGC